MNNNISFLIGNTPLYEIKNMESYLKLSSSIYCKLEMFNLTGSVKDRAALFMIEAAEKSGKLKNGGTIIEATSGNTGIGLAAIGVSKGYKVIIVMPETMSQERQSLMKSYGAQVILTPGQGGMQASIEKALELKANIPGAFISSQFDNPNNPNAHYKTTGVEIYNQTNGKIDAFVAGVGTGGTISGVGRYLKERNPNIKIIAVQPLASEVLTGGKPGPHNIQGIGANFIPKNYDKTVVDEIISIDGSKAFQRMRELAKKEGILAGISSGAAIEAAIEVSNKYKNIVVLLPDSGSRYLSTGLFEEE